MVNFSDTKLATKQDLKDMYDRMYPYLGGMPEVLANKFSKGDMYSTDEKMIGQWVDGKPLYQKVFSVVDTGNSSTHTITIPSTLNIESVVYFKAEKVCEGYGISIPYTESNHVITVSKPVTSGDIVFTKDTATVWSGTYYLTMKYTKTTDSSISIGDDTDYSTEEKIVGTWIDGKPIYQITVSGLNVTLKYNDWLAVASIPNIYRIINVALYGDAGADTHQLKFDTAGVEFVANDGEIRAEYTANPPSKRTVKTITIQYTKTTD